MDVLVDFARTILSAFSDLQFTDQDVIEGQDAVTIRTRNEGTHTGAFLGVPATGRRIASDNSRWCTPETAASLASGSSRTRGASISRSPRRPPEAPRGVAAEPPVDWAHSAR
jgi:hypothetical protein